MLLRWDSIHVWFVLEQIFWIICIEIYGDNRWWIAFFDKAFTKIFSLHFYTFSLQKAPKVDIFYSTLLIYLRDKVKFDEVIKEALRQIRDRKKPRDQFSFHWHTNRRFETVRIPMHTEMRLAKLFSDWFNDFFPHYITVSFEDTKNVKIH